MPLGDISNHPPARRISYSGADCSPPAASDNAGQVVRIMVLDWLNAWRKGQARMPIFAFDGKGCGVWHFYGFSGTHYPLAHDKYFAQIVHLLPDREEQLLAIVRVAAEERAAAARAAAAKRAAESEVLREQALALIETALHAEDGPRDLVGLMQLCAERAKTMASEAETTAEAAGVLAEEEEETMAAEAEPTAEAEPMELMAEAEAPAEEKKEQEAGEEEAAVAMTPAALAPAPLPPPLPSLPSYAPASPQGPAAMEAEEVMSAEEEELTEEADAEQVTEAEEEEVTEKADADVSAGCKRAKQSGKPKQSKRQKQAIAAGLPTNAAELIRAIAEQDLGLTTDRSSTLAARTDGVQQGGGRRQASRPTAWP